MRQISYHVTWGNTIQNNTKRFVFLQEEETIRARISKLRNICLPCFKYKYLDIVSITNTVMVVSIVLFLVIKRNMHDLDHVLPHSIYFSANQTDKLVLFNVNYEALLAGSVTTSYGTLITMSQSRWTLHRSIRLNGVHEELHAC